MKSRLIAVDLDGARSDARWALEAGAEESRSPIGRYAAALASLVLGEDERAAELAATLLDGEDFPPAVAESLATLAVGDAPAYEEAIRALLDDFEGREEYLEDTPVADTVLAFQVLARERRLEVALVSPLLPGS
jgi:hypothetical protein